MTQVVRIAQKPHTHRPLWDSWLPPATTHVITLAAERHSFQGWSSVASTIQGENSIPTCMLINSGSADTTQQVTSTPSVIQRRARISPMAMLGTSCYCRPASGGTIQTDSTHHVVSSLASGIASTPTHLSGLENLPTHILIQKPAQPFQIHCECELQK
jgi:hypothetical protein